MTNKEIADQMAMHMILGTTIPDELTDNLMRQMCEEVKQEREGSKSSDSKVDVAGV
jgi:hypothetical protein